MAEQEEKTTVVETTAQAPATKAKAGLNIWLE